MSMVTNVVIALLLLWFWFYDLPRDAVARKFLRPLMGPMQWLGLWHGWSMFAPEPLHVNRRIRAELMYSDGSVDEWRPIEPRRTNWFMDWLWFRYFKYQSSLLCGTNKALYRPLCEFLVQQATEEGLQVQSVKLVREYQYVQPPDADEPLGPWQESVIHEWSSLD